MTSDAPTDDESAPATGWVELEFDVDREHADALSDSLIEHGAMSVQVLDGQAGTIAEQPVFGEPGMPVAPLGWAVSKLVVLAADESSGRANIAQAASALGITLPSTISARTLAPQDWVGLTQSQFEPMAIGERLWITPTWHRDRPAGIGREVILLDPGLAFGTGSHPTTRLCLAWLEANLRVGESVLDYGCGSGILAIAASKLGAGHVIGIDIDEQAVASARANAAANGVDIAFTSSRDALPSVAGVVVANILASPLKVLAPLLEDLVQPGGSLVLAGLLDSQVAEVAACYRRIEMSGVANEDGWSLLTGRRARSELV